MLLRLAGEVGLDVERARAVLDSDEFTAEVRERERFWQERGINGVPAVVIDGKHLISGGQPPEVFEQALRQIAAGRLGRARKERPDATIRHGFGPNRAASAR